MRYYQDRLTRAIYSDRELAEMTQARAITPREVAIRFEALPEPKQRLLEESEGGAANRRRQQGSAR